MTQAEVVTACMEQAKFAYSMHNDRRSYEWKITLGLWAVILATIAKGFRLPWWGWTPIVLAYSFLWLRGVWVANKNNKLWYDFFKHAAGHLLCNPAHGVGAAPDRLKPWSRIWLFGFLGDWAMLFQLVATLALVFLAFLSGMGVIPLGPDDHDKITRIVVDGCRHGGIAPQ